MAATSPGEWTSQLRRGVLELCVLRILRNRTSYGYEIVATLEAWAPLAAGENTVYPLLRRLKSDGQLETFMAESPAGPPRQYFRLTPQGRRRLQLLEKEWGELARAVEECMNSGGAR